MSEDNYVNVFSLAESSAINSGNSGKWEPRDALIHTLRKLDSKEIEMESVLISWESPVKDQERRSYGYAMSSKDMHVTLGTLDFVKSLILKEIGNYKDSVVSVDREIESKTLVAQHQKRTGDKKGLSKTLKELEDLQIKKEAMEKEIIGPLKKQAKDITDNIDKVFERLRKEKLGK